MWQIDAAVTASIAVRPSNAAHSTHTYRLLARAHADCSLLLDTSKEVACIKLTLSLTLIARNQISESKHGRLIAESQLANKYT
jgi:hypothetical protein